MTSNAGIVSFARELKSHSEYVFDQTRLGKYISLDQFRNNASGFDALLNIGENNQITCSVTQFLMDLRVKSSTV